MPNTPIQPVLDEAATDPRTGGVGPLDRQQLEQVERAAERLRALRTASSLARFNGISLWLCAVLCLPLALLDGSMLLIAVVLGAFGSVELRGGGMVRALDVSGPRLLMLNQLAVFGAFALYCLYSIYSGLTGPSPYETLLAEHPDIGLAMQDAGLQAGDLGENVEGMYRAGVVGFYLVLLAVVGAYQGLCAFYYHTRRELLSSYVAETPGWVRELQRRLG